MEKVKGAIRDAMLLLETLNIQARDSGRMDQVWRALNFAAQRIDGLQKAAGEDTKPVVGNKKKKGEETEKIVEQ